MVQIVNIVKEKPKVKSWTIDDVKNLFIKINLEKYIPNIEKNAIDGKIIKEKEIIQIIETEKEMESENNIKDENKINQEIKDKEQDKEYQNDDSNENKHKKYIEDFIDLKNEKEDENNINNNNIIIINAKESDEKKNKLLKLQFVILPEKKRIIQILIFITVYHYLIII